MQQVIAIALAAGMAAAFMSGVVFPGSTMLVPLTFIAPAPLLIAGLGWHPLLAALGALFAAVGISILIGSKVALSFIVMVGLPAYLLAEAVNWLMRSMPAGTPHAIAGRVFGLYILIGIAAYAALAILIGAMAVDTSYAVFEQRLAATFERMMQQFGRDAGGLDTTTMRQLSQVFVRLFVPMSAVLIAAILSISLWLSVRILRRSERLPFPALPSYHVSLPREAVFALIGAVMVAQSSGFLGLFGTAFAGALMFMFMLDGLAMLHVRTLGNSSRTPVLVLSWVILFLFAPAALIFSLAGIFDALFGLRRDAPPTH